MKRLHILGAFLIIAISAVVVVVGSVFIVQGQNTKQLIIDGLRSESVTLGIEEANASNGEVVDNMQEAQLAADTITLHLRERYGTYAETARGSEERAQYLDGLTLINSLNTAVMGFGMTTVITVTGVLLVAVGLATGTTGIALTTLARKID